MLAKKSRCTFPCPASAPSAAKSVDLAISSNHDLASSSFRKAPTVNHFSVLNNVLVDDVSDNNIAYVLFL